MESHQKGAPTRNGGIETTATGSRLMKSSADPHFIRMASETPKTKAQPPVNRTASAGLVHLEGNRVGQRLYRHVAREMGRDGRDLAAVAQRLADGDRFGMARQRNDVPCPARGSGSDDGAADAGENEAVVCGIEIMVAARTVHGDCLRGPKRSAVQSGPMRPIPVVMRPSRLKKPTGGMVNPKKPMTPAETRPDSTVTIRSRARS